LVFYIESFFENNSINNNNLLCTDNAPVWFVGTAQANFTGNVFFGNKLAGGNTQPNVFYGPQNVGNIFVVGNTFIQNTFNRTSSTHKYFYSPNPMGIINNTFNTSCMGNYYTNFSGLDYSYTCADADNDGICDIQFSLSIPANHSQDKKPISIPTMPIKCYSKQNEYWPSKALETRNDNYNISGTSFNCSSLTGIFWQNGTPQSGVTATNNGILYNFSYYGIPNNLQGEINQTNVTFWWDIKCGTVNTTNTTRSNIVERLRLLPCAAPMGNSTIKFSIFDEDLPTLPVVSSFSSLFNIWIDSGSRNYTYSNSSYVSYDYCIFPGQAAYKANISATYSNTSYSTRNFFSQSSSYSNVTSQINLYSLALTNSTNIFFTIYNVNKVPQNGAILKVLKYSPSTGTFTTVAYGLTGYDGMVMIPLELYQYYQYVIQMGGVSVTTIASSQLSNIVQNLYISLGNYITLFNYQTQVSGGCSANNVTKILTCTSSDSSGQMATAKLDVSRMKAANYSSPICSTSGSGSAVTLVCDYHIYNTSNIFYNFYGVFSGETYTIDSGWINQQDVLMNLGTMGVFLALALVITLFFAGITTSPSTAIILGSIGVLASSLIGLISIGWGNLLPFLLIGVIMVYKLGED